MKLIRKQYLGNDGYVHAFKHIETGAIKYVPTTKEQYEKMAEKGGEKHNPTLEGYEWVGAMGGSIRVDNEDSVLKEGEYTETEKGFYAVIREGGRKTFKEFPKEAIENDTLKDNFIVKKNGNRIR